MLITSIITFDTWLAGFIIEIGVWSSCEGDHGNCMQFMANDDSEWNEAVFSGICSYAEEYKVIESHGGNILLRNWSFYS